MNIAHLLTVACLFAAKNTHAVGALTLKDVSAQKSKKEENKTTHAMMHGLIKTITKSLEMMQEKDFKCRLNEQQIELYTALISIGGKLTQLGSFPCAELDKIDLISRSCVFFLDEKTLLCYIGVKIYHYGRGLFVLIDSCYNGKKLNEEYDTCDRIIKILSTISYKITTDINPFFDSFCVNSKIAIDIMSISDTAAYKIQAYMSTITKDPNFFMIFTECIRYVADIEKGRYSIILFDCVKNDRTLKELLLIDYLMPSKVK